MDLTSAIGIVAGIGFIITGQFLEGGNIGQLLQITAAFIVLGGTFGAILVSFPLENLANAVFMLKDIFFMAPPDFETIIKEITEFAGKARKEGIIALEKEASKASDPLMILGLEAVSDGSDPALVKAMLGNQIDQLAEKVEGAAKVWESAGGFAPTIGIIGAVLGLIQVMQHLSDPSKLGAGIAVAFVATIYGVGSANLMFIPFATKLKIKYKKVFVMKELITEGILSIQAGESPALIERKLNTFILDSHMKK